VNQPSRQARRSSLPPARDQHETAFTRILAELVLRVPGAHAAALVDVEGETVDYSGFLLPYDVKVAAAQWRIIIDDVRVRAPLARTNFIATRAARSSYQVHVLPEGYALVLVLSRAAGFGGWHRAVASCCSALAREASWSTASSRAPTWYGVPVIADARRRPLALGRTPRARTLEVLGAVASGMRRRERGWRIRLDNGVEATLVREAGGHWYVDEIRALPEPGPQAK